MTGRYFSVTNVALVIILLISGCGINPISDNEGEQLATQKKDTALVSIGITSKSAERFRDMKLTHPLNAGMLEHGKAIYDAKCSSCHKLTEERLVGPGFKGVTTRRTPEWIMNFITNNTAMFEKNHAPPAEMVICIIHIPNQDLSDVQARQILEFMRQNDGKN